MPALEEDAVDTSSFDPEAYLAERDAGTSSTDGFDPEAYLAERDAQNVPSTDGFDPEAYLAERAGQKVAAANPDVAATTQAVATTPAKIDPAKNDKWNAMQARSNAMADEAGLPPAASARDRLIGAIQRSEAAGYPVKHFIGSPNEPTGDRGPTMDVENLVGALRQRAAKDPSAAKELAYWERDLAENGMTAEQWKQQTGEAEPGTPQGYVGKGEFAPEANVAPIVPRQPGQTSMDSFKKAMTEPAVTFEPIKIEQSDSELTKIDKTQQNLIKGFVSGATSPLGALALLSPFIALSQIATSAPDIIKKLEEADNTPAGSPERHEAAAETIATILPFAIHGMVKSIRGEPKAGEPPTEPNPAEVPVTQPTEVAPESPATEIAQPQTATEPVAETPAEPIGQEAAIAKLNEQLQPEMIPGTETPRPTLPSDRAPFPAPEETAPVEAPAVSGEPLGTGISNERLQEIYGDAAPVATTGKGPAEWKNIGQTRLEDFQKSGKPENDPATVLTNLREGKVPMSQVPHDVSLLRAEHQRLLESARKAEGTPEYEAKAQASLDMATAIKEVAHGPASDVFRALQEYDQPKYDNVTDFDQAVRERMGRETNASEKAQFQKIADEVGKTRDLAGKEIEATQKKLQRFRGKEKMSFDDATKKVHEQIEQLVKDCIL